MDNEMRMIPQHNIHSYFTPLPLTLSRLNCICEMIEQRNSIVQKFKTKEVKTCVRSFSCLLLGCSSTVKLTLECPVSGDPTKYLFRQACILKMRKAFERVKRNDLFHTSLLLFRGRFANDYSGQKGLKQVSNTPSDDLRALEQFCCIARDLTICS